MVAIFILAINSLKEKKFLAEYVLELKNYYIHNYLETRFSVNTQDEINEINTTSIKPKISSLGPKATIPKSAPSPVLAPLPITQNAGVEEQQQGITIDKNSISIENNTLTLSFWMLNTHKNKPIAGTVCAQLETLIDGQKTTLNYPTNLKVNEQSAPTAISCSFGEHVKFSRLRPVEFEFEKIPDNLKALNARIYFVEKNSKNISLIKDLQFN